MSSPMNYITQLLVFTPRNDATLVHLRVDLGLAWLDIARLMHRGLELCIARGAQLGLSQDYVNDRTWTSHEDRVLDSTIRSNPHVPQTVLFERISTVLWDRSPGSCAHRYGACNHLREWEPTHDFALTHMAFFEFEDNWERGLMLSEHLGRRYRISKTACEKRLAMLTSAPLGPSETIVFPVPYAVADQLPRPLITNAGWLGTVAGEAGGGVVRASEAIAAAKCEHLFRLGLVHNDIALVLNRPTWSVRNHLMARGFDLNSEAVEGGSRRGDWTLGEDRMLDINHGQGHGWFAISQVFYGGLLSPFVPLHRQRVDCMLRYTRASHLGGWARENDRLLENISWVGFEHEWETSLRYAMPPRCTKGTCEMRLLMLEFGYVPHSHLL